MPSKTPKLTSYSFFLQNSPFRERNQKNYTIRRSMTINSNNTHKLCSIIFNNVTQVFFFLQETTCVYRVMLASTPKSYKVKTNLSYVLKQIYFSISNYIQHYFFLFCQLSFSLPFTHTDSFKPVYQCHGNRNYFSFQNFKNSYLF